MPIQCFWFTLNNWVFFLSGVTACYQSLYQTHGLTSIASLEMPLTHATSSTSLFSSLSQGLTHRAEDTYETIQMNKKNKQ